MNGNASLRVISFQVTRGIFFSFFFFSAPHQHFCHVTIFTTPKQTTPNNK